MYKTQAWCIAFTPAFTPAFTQPCGGGRQHRVRKVMGKFNVLGLQVVTGTNDCDSVTATKGSDDDSDK